MGRLRDPTGVREVALSRAVSGLRLGSMPAARSREVGDTGTDAPDRHCDPIGASGGPRPTIARYSGTRDAQLEDAGYRASWLVRIDREAAPAFVGVLALPAHLVHAPLAENRAQPRPRGWRTASRRLKSLRRLGHRLIATQVAMRASSGPGAIAFLQLSRHLRGCLERRRRTKPGHLARRWGSRTSNAERAIADSPAAQPGAICGHSPRGGRFGLRRRRDLSSASAYAARSAASMAAMRSSSRSRPRRWRSWIRSCWLVTSRVTSA